MSDLGSRHWLYEPDQEPKKKHAWDRPEPGFVTLRSGDRIGKCPSGIGLAMAENVLNTGIEWSPRKGWGRKYPKKIWFIHEGWLYRAEPTNPGRSYHAFPEDPERQLHIPLEVAKRLREQASRTGQYEALKRWIRG